MKIFLYEANYRKTLSFLRAFSYWIIFAILLFLAASQSGAIFSPKVHLFVYALAGAAIAFVVAWILRAERKSLADFKLVWQRDTLLKFFKGLAIGVASFLTIVLVLVLFANLKINRNPEAWTACTFILVSVHLVISNC